MRGLTFPAKYERGEKMDKQKELTALLFAISVVSERLAQNMEREVKRNESNQASSGHHLRCPQSW